MPIDSAQFPTAVHWSPVTSAGSHIFQYPDAAGPLPTRLGQKPGTLRPARARKPSLGTSPQTIRPRGVDTAELSALESSI